MKVKSVEVQYTKRSHRRPQKVRVYFWPEGESILDNLMNRHSRPSRLYRLVFPEVQKLVNNKGDIIDLSGAKWSQKAGCACGCSPGFVVDGYYGFDVHVTVTE